MSELLSSIKELSPQAQFAVIVIITLFCGALLKAAGWVFMEYWHDSKEKQKTHDLALTQNTVAITRLEVQIDRLNEFLHVIPKIQADLTSAHQKIRELEKG